MVIVELRRSGNLPSPLLRSHCVAVETVDKHEARFRLAHAGKQGREGALSSSRWSLQENSFALPNGKTARMQCRSSILSVAKCDFLDFRNRPAWLLARILR